MESQQFSRSPVHSPSSSAVPPHPHHHPGVQSSAGPDPQSLSRPGSVPGRPAANAEVSPIHFTRAIRRALDLPAPVVSDLPARRSVRARELSLPQPAAVLPEVVATSGEEDLPAGSDSTVLSAFPAEVSSHRPSTLRSAGHLEIVNPLYLDSPTVVPAMLHPAATAAGPAVVCTAGSAPRPASGLPSNHPEQHSVSRGSSSQGESHCPVAPPSPTPEYVRYPPPLPPFAMYPPPLPPVVGYPPPPPPALLYSSPSTLPMAAPAIPTEVQSELYALRAFYAQYLATTGMARPPTTLSAFPHGQLQSSPLEPVFLGDGLPGPDAAAVPASGRLGPDAAALPAYGRSGPVAEDHLGVGDNSRDRLPLVRADFPDARASGPGGVRRTGQWGRDVAPDVPGVPGPCAPGSRVANVAPGRMGPVPAVSGRARGDGAVMHDGGDLRPVATAVVSGSESALRGASSHDRVRQSVLRDRAVDFGPMPPSVRVGHSTLREAVSDQLPDLSHSNPYYADVRVPVVRPVVSSLDLPAALPAVSVKDNRSLKCMDYDGFNQEFAKFVVDKGVRNLRHLSACRSRLLGMVHSCMRGFHAPFAAVIFVTSMVGKFKLFAPQSIEQWVTSNERDLFDAAADFDVEPPVDGNAMPWLESVIFAPLQELFCQTCSADVQAFYRTRFGYDPYGKAIPDQDVANWFGTMWQYWAKYVRKDVSQDAFLAVIQNGLIASGRIR